MPRVIPPAEGLGYIQLCEKDVVAPDRTKWLVEWSTYATIHKAYLDELTRNKWLETKIELLESQLSRAVELAAKRQGKEP